MSLVDYDTSSDEESDNESPKAIIVTNMSVANAPKLLTSEDEISNGNVSDEDDDRNSSVKKGYINSLSQLLPKPRNDASVGEIFEKPSFFVLPIPKTIDTAIDIEDDDEFLNKKPNEEIIDKPNRDTEIKKNPVKITIPSLNNFKDVEKEMEFKAKSKSIFGQSRSLVSSGLLSILPKAKSEQSFTKIASTSNENNRTANATIVAEPAIIPCFVPDVVKHRRPATNTEDVDRRKPTKHKLHKQINKTPVHSNKNTDSDESDDDNNEIGNFFSFNSDQKLPNVSSTEINALVAKKVAKIAKACTNYLTVSESQGSNDVEIILTDSQELESSRISYQQEQQLNSEALQALVGGGTKRRRQKQVDIQVIDINSSQVLPKKDEWMRTALASSTSYQPTGVLVDEEPASGTRRKHQITYLAHKAKANEAELQAMWSANRQSRRATQNKYGF